LRHAEGLADALDAAHHRDILHRDVNPNNVMVRTDGRAQLMDFGLARVMDAPADDELSTRSHSSEVPETGRAAGTPGYMSPEQVLGRPLDGRSDIFSFGVVLYEMWNGGRPFRASGEGGLVDAILHAQPAETRKPANEAETELQRITRKALAKRPDERYQSAADLLADVRALRRRVDSQDYVSGHPPPGAPSLRGKRLRTALGLVLLALASVVVAVGLQRWAQKEPPVFAERDWLLIADFENTTAEPIFDETLREGLAVALNQSQYVNVLPRSRVVEALHRMKREPGTPVDTNLGREICQREDVKVLLAGSIRRSGDAFQMRLQTIEPASGRLLFAESEQFTAKEHLFVRVDSLARRVREDLGESLTRIEKSSRPLEKATTRSLEALQLFSKAVRVRAEGDLTKAATLLQSALGIDPAFAMAHLHLAGLYFDRGDVAVARKHYGRAYDLRSEVTERERHLITADYYTGQGEFSKARETLRMLVGLYPDDLEARHKLALAYDAALDFQGAISEQREVLRLDPLNPQSYSTLGLFLVSANDAAQAVALYDQARAKGLSSPDFGWGLGLARLCLGDVGEAVAEFRSLEAAGPAYEALGQLYLARTAIYQGRLSDAAEQLDRGIRLDDQRNNQVYRMLRQGLRARVRWSRGDERGARQDLNSILAIDDDVDTSVPYLLTTAGRLALDMGDVQSARRALDRIRRVQRPDDGLPSAGASDLEGGLLLAEGRVPEAIERFQASRAQYPLHESLSDLARAYQAQRDWKHAAGTWQKVVDAQGLILRSGHPAEWVLAHLELARSLRALGDVAGARKAYETFLRLWQDADRSALLERAAREFHELGGEDRTVSEGPSVDP
jgi:tetratricopeptide (TPR) repeat protein